MAKLLFLLLLAGAAVGELEPRGEPPLLIDSSVSTSLDAAG